MRKYHRSITGGEVAPKSRSIPTIMARLNLGESPDGIFSMFGVESAELGVGSLSEYEDFCQGGRMESPNLSCANEAFGSTADSHDQLDDGARPSVRSREGDSRFNNRSLAPPRHGHAKSGLEAHIAF